MLDVLTISSPALPGDTRVVGFRGTEGISRLYVFELHFTIAADAANDFDLASVTGGKGSLVIDLRDGRPSFAFHGIFSEAAIIHHEPDGRALVRALLVPKLWRLTQTHHSRIFTQQSIPEILKKTLEDGGLTSDDYSLRLNQQYPPEEHVCQYRESHFEFISRWMEREGLYYWFEQGDGGEKLIIADDKATHEDLVSAPVRFFALSGVDGSAGECLETFVCRHRALPASVRFKDHDYTKPALDVSGSAPVSKTGLGQISIHGARFFTPDAGQRLARLRAEEILAREQVFTASGTALYLRAGYTFSLYDHPRSDFDAKYLVTEVEHYGNQSASTPALRRITGLTSEELYRVDVTAIAATVQFRAELRTPWPRIYGTEHGTVDGEADSDYAQLDEQGRYTVRFAFDESDLGDGKASTRVRMMQPHGGGVEGWHFPLRKNTEVLFTFLGGDPDRPVIAGVVPNAFTASPVTKANQTRNVIQTGGRNRIEIEDKAGFERITLSTPNANSMIRMGSPNKDHEMIIKTDGATVLDAGQDWDVKVGADLTESVDGATNETYTGDHTTQSWAKRTVEVGGGYFQNIHGSAWRKINGSHHSSVDGNQELGVGGQESHKVGGSLDVKISGAEDHKVSGKYNLDVGATITIAGTGGVTLRSPAAIVLDAPEVTNKATGTWHKLVGIGLEAYVMKGSLGGLKIDSAALSISGYGLKVETTAFAAGKYGSKGDTVGVKRDDFGAVFQNIGADTKRGLVAAYSFALMKLGG